MENTKIYVVCKNSQKGTPYQALVADLGYCTKTLTFDRATISELTDISLKDLSQMQIDSKKCVGSLVKEVK